jgi:hypothetical protein
MAELVIYGQDAALFQHAGFDDPKTSLLIWRAAFGAQHIEPLMTSQAWPLRVLGAFPISEGWGWVVRTSSDPEKEISDPKAVQAHVSAACGRVTGVPQGNICATLSLRKYEEQTHSIGGFRWFQENLNRIDQSDSGIAAFLDRLLGVLKEAEEAGACLMVEQMAIILAKDPSAPLATLTPTLHSDMYYGFRETAILSLIEQGQDQSGGSLFLPDMKMSELAMHRPIDLAKMWSLVEGRQVLNARSGDLAVYDGMIDRSRNDEAVFENGTPHISPDIPGKSARLVILMRVMKPSNHSPVC